MAHRDLLHLVLLLPSILYVVTYPKNETPVGALVRRLLKPVASPQVQLDPGLPPLCHSALTVGMAPS